jgi:hypothetical protein
MSRLLSTFQRLGALDQDARAPPRPVPTMIDIGVASPSAHGHAMIKHRDRVDQAVSMNLSDLITGSRGVAES